MGNEKQYTVYKHTSPSGKVYIGITSLKPADRWRCGYKHSPHFQAAINKYGWENIQHEILATGLTKEAACAMEIELIAQHNATDRRYGYNADLGGFVRGKASEETRRKLSEANRGEKHHYFGKHLSAEHRKKLSESLKGKKMPPRSDQHRRKLSKALTGKHLSAETKQKLSVAHKGRQLSEEHRQKISMGLLGHRVSVDGMRRTTEAKYKPVRCLETGRVFPSIKVAAATTGANPSNISAVCRGQRKHTLGLHFEFVEGVV